MSRRSFYFGVTSKLSDHHGQNKVAIQHFSAPLRRALKLHLSVSADTPLSSAVIIILTHHDAGGDAMPLSSGGSDSARSPVVAKVRIDEQSIMILSAFWRIEAPVSTNFTDSRPRQPRAWARISGEAAASLSSIT